MQCVGTSRQIAARCDRDALQPTREPEIPVALRDINTGIQEFALKRRTRRPNTRDQ
jgi:hypothetical protein